MAKEKEPQPCKTDCREYINGNCRLRIKDDTPTESSKVVLGTLCPWYVKVKMLFEQ